MAVGGIDSGANEAMAGVRTGAVMRVHIRGNKVCQCMYNRVAQYKFDRIF